MPAQKNALSEIPRGRMWSGFRRHSHVGERGGRYVQACSREQVNRSEYPHQVVRVNSHRLLHLE